MHQCCHLRDLEEANDATARSRTRPTTTVTVETREATDAAPRELVREVAASLKSLAKVLPYPEYAAIVRTIADLRWRCASNGPASASYDSLGSRGDVGQRSADVAELQGSSLRIP